MNNIAGLLAELQHLLTQLTLTTEDNQFTLPAIGKQASDSSELFATLNALIAEGDIHHAGTWAAHMTPTISAASLLGQLLAGLHNGNLLSPQLYPVLAKIEQQILTWLCSLFGHQYGHFVAGSSYANLEALWQAKQQYPNANRVVYASTAAHYSIAKACQILDLELKYIATDNNDQLSIEALRQACQQQSPLAIVATAGTAAAGIIDPLADCVQIAQQFDCWCHIDAAWGGALAILPEYKSLFSNASGAGSICFDPHKGWHQPKPASVLLYQRALNPMLSADANYLEFEPFNSLPGSRGGELFLPLWLSLMFSGVEELTLQLQHRLQQAEQLSTQLSMRSNWQVYPSVTGIICFQPDPTVNLTTLVDRGILSKANVAGKGVYRAVFATPNTSAAALITVLEPHF